MNKIKQDATSKKAVEHFSLT